MESAVFNMSLGNGLSKLSGKVFRIGHLGDFNDLMLIATLGGIKMALGCTKIPHQAGGTLAAMQFLKEKIPKIFNKGIEYYTSNVFRIADIFSPYTAGF